jgi:hypothetical protein
MKCGDDRDDGGVYSKNRTNKIQVPCSPVLRNVISVSTEPTEVHANEFTMHVEQQKWGLNKKYRVVQ